MCICNNIALYIQACSKFYIALFQEVAARKVSVMFLCSQHLLSSEVSLDASEEPSQNMKKKKPLMVWFLADSVATVLGYSKMIQDL